MGGGVPDVSLFLFRADRDVYIVGIIMGNAVAPRGGLGGGVCRRLMVGVMVADISMCATVGRCEAYRATASCPPSRNFASRSSPSARSASLTMA